MEVSEEFPPDIEAAARQAASNLKLPDLDRTDIPFITIDPATSMDLDQALHIERDGDGYVVYYAIADVASFVEFGGPLDQEANRRGQTLYGADSKIPLHPKVLSDDAASLLAEQVRSRA
ncbi:MAG: RNB domain-containing ribonuclease [Propionibacteriales bacterium]|nr:RNB domain-containing ribonuclease [Propionibacteriales bacterium]